MKRIAIIISIFALSSCAYNRTGEIVMDKKGDFYELTVPTWIWPSEAYRLTRVDTAKFAVRGFCNSPISK